MIDNLLADPKGFFQKIPSDRDGNLKFRETFNKLMETFPEYVDSVKTAFLQYPPLFFNIVGWTFNPQKGAGERDCPFILRPQQIKVVEAIDECYHGGKEVVIDKSRNEGASELICKYLALQWLLSPNFQALMGSRRENLVDNKVNWKRGFLTGDKSCLFHRVMYGLYKLPEWLRPDPKHIAKTHLLLQNLENGAQIAGESTNENLGAGLRYSIVFIDEIGRVDMLLAQRIIESVSDVANCVIYCSTHFYGVGHPYNRLLTGDFGQKTIITLPWEKNPEKNKGMYISPSEGVIQIKDIDYYREICPSVFDSIEPMQPVEVSDIAAEIEEYGISFIADGGDSNEGGWRSPWYDQESKTRSPRDVAQNIDRRPIGAGATFFSLAVLHRIEQEYCRKPDYVLDVKPVLQNNRIAKAIVEPDSSGYLEWWGKLTKGRPDQSCKYVISADISRGTGASNSTLGIYDVYKRERVGSFACSTVTPEDFADLLAAVWMWCGGVSSPYIIWEESGPGQLFSRRLLQHGIGPLYEDRDPTKFGSPRKKRWGWFSSTKKKRQLLIALDAALAAGVSGLKDRPYLIIHDINLVKEYEIYIEAPDGNILPAYSLSDTSGARSAHGDRVINDMLFMAVLPIFGSFQQEEPKQPSPYNSFGKRLQDRKFQREHDKLNSRFFYG